MGTNNQNNLPGYRVGQTMTPRNILASDKNLVYGRGVIDASLTIDGTNTGFTHDLRQGLPMGRITASGLWTICRRTTVLSGAGTVTTCVLTNPLGFMVGDKILIGTDAVTILTIDYTTGAITHSSITLANGDAVVADSGQTQLAGAEICRGFLNEFVRTLEPDGIITNRSFGKMVIEGIVMDSMLLGDKTAIFGDTGNKLTGIIRDIDKGQA